MLALASCISQEQGKRNMQRKTKLVMPNENGQKGGMISFFTVRRLGKLEAEDGSREVRGTRQLSQAWQGGWGGHGRSQHATPIPHVASRQIRTRHTLGFFPASAWLAAALEPPASWVLEPAA